MSFYGAVASDYVTLRFVHKPDILAAITRLSTCEQHQGCHHFTVVGEGHVLLCGPIGERCLSAGQLRSKAIEEKLE